MTKWQVNLQFTSFPETSAVPDHQSPSQRPYAHTQHGHFAGSRSADISSFLPKSKSHSPAHSQNHSANHSANHSPNLSSHRSSHSRPPTPPSPTPIKESVTNYAIFPALPAMALSPSNNSAITSSHPQRAPRHSIKRSPPKPPPKRPVPNLTMDLKTITHSPNSRDLDLQSQSANNGMNGGGGGTKSNTNSLTSSNSNSLSAGSAHLEDGSSSPTSPHRMSVSEHRRLHRSTNSFSATMKLGHHDTSQSKVSPYGEEPSLRDSKWLRDELKSRNNAGDYSAVLLQVK